MNHTSLLNYLISKYELKSYFEIGINNPANNFDKIKCSAKTGVDPEVTGRFEIFPMPSDVYFSHNIKTFDLIFIDGLHHADQVERDFNNSLQCLNDNGFILIHDCLPQHELTTYVPRQIKQWHGDVYKFCLKLHTYSDIGYVTLNMDEGCCLVFKQPGKKPIKGYNDWPLDWNTYKEIGNILLNVIPVDIFLGEDKYLPVFKKEPA